MYFLDCMRYHIYWLCEFCARVWGKKRRYSTDYTVQRSPRWCQHLVALKRWCRRAFSPVAIQFAWQCLVSFSFIIIIIIFVTSIFYLMQICHQHTMRQLSSLWLRHMTWNGLKKECILFQRHDKNQRIFRLCQIRKGEISRPRRIARVIEKKRFSYEILC